jgi:hypothetical protein
MKTALWYAALAVVVERVAHVSLWSVVAHGWATALPALEALR